MAAGPTTAAAASLPVAAEGAAGEAVAATEGTAASADYSESRQQEGQSARQFSNWIQVSLEKAPTFYARLGRRMLENASFDEVVVTGLGNATNVAIGTASIMEREEVATITKVETDYYTSTRIVTTSRAKKRLPKITITLARSAKMIAHNEAAAAAAAANEGLTEAAAADEGEGGGATTSGGVPQSDPLVEVAA